MLKTLLEEKQCVAIENDGSSGGLTLVGRGRAPAPEGILAICLATQPWAEKHAKSQDMALIQGISCESMRFCAGEVRRQMAALNIEEQKLIVFVRGELVEWDETGARSERVKCPRRCTQCTECAGYRLLWNQWIIGVVRGNRKQLVIYQLVEEVSP